MDNNPTQTTVAPIISGNPNQTVQATPDLDAGKHTYYSVTHKRLSQSPLLYVALIITFGSIAITGLLTRSLFTETPQGSASASDRYADLTHLYEDDVTNYQNAKVLYKAGPFLNFEVLYVLTYDGYKSELREETGGIVRIKKNEIVVSQFDGRLEKKYNLATNAIFFLDTGKGSLAILGRGYAEEFFDEDREVYFDVLRDISKDLDTVTAVYLTAGPDYDLNVSFMNGEIVDHQRGFPEFTINSRTAGSLVFAVDNGTKIIGLGNLLE